MVFSVTVLGSNSAIPAYNRFPTSQLLNVSEAYYLIDCGEGTQIRLRQNKFKLQRIQHIFISHLHGDHFFGLVGLLTTMQLLGRERPLSIYSPPQLKSIIDQQLKVGKSGLQFEVNYFDLEIKESEEILSDKFLTVKAFPLKHRISCYGFLFKEKIKPRKLNKAAIDKAKVPLEWMKRIKDGEDFVSSDGDTIVNDVLTFDPPPSRSYAYCTDTRYLEDIIPIVKGVDLLYHEATFLNDMRERAHETGHSTAMEAALIAREAEVGKLILGHYSARYKDLQPLLEEARSIYPKTVLGLEDETYLVPLDSSY